MYARYNTHAVRLVIVMCMNKYIVSLLALLLMCSYSFAEELYLSLGSIKHGSPFPDPYNELRLGRNKPITQFKVPNYGDESKIFPEYEVVILDSNKNVVIVTAELVTRSDIECKKLLKEFEKYSQEKFPDYKIEDSDNSKRVGFGEKRFYKDSENTYYNLTCIGKTGPFITLHYQIRGLIEDEQLKLAWEQVFKEAN